MNKCALSCYLGQRQYPHIGQPHRTHNASRSKPDSHRPSTLTKDRITTIKSNLALLIRLLLLCLMLAPAHGHKTKHDPTGLNYTPEEQQWLSDTPVVVVGVQPDWKPFDFSDPELSSPRGIVQDLVMEISRQTGIIPAYRVADWHTLYTEFSQGGIDLLPAIRHTEQREVDGVLFTEPYMNLYQYFFAHSDAIPTLAIDFKEARLAIPRSYAIADVAQAMYPEMQLVPVDTMEEAINKVMSREADLLLDIYSSINYHLKEKGIQLIQPYRPFETLELRMAVTKSQPVLASIIRKTLADIPPSYIHQLSLQWLPSAQSPGFIPLDQEELDWLRKHPVITVDNHIHWLPLADSRDRSIDGITGDVLSYIGNRLNVNFLHVHQPQDAAARPESSTPDGSPATVSATAPASHSAITPATTLAQAPPQVVLIDQAARPIPEGYQRVIDLGEYPLVVITHQHMPFINSLDELEDQTLVGVAQATYLRSLNTHHPELTFDTRPTGADVLMAVRAGEYDAAVLPAAQASYLMQLSEFQQLTISGVANIQVSAALLVHQDYPILADTMARTYAQMTEAERAAIVSAWGKLPTPPPFNYNLFIQIALLVLLIMGISFYWNRKLSQEVRHRKAIEISVRQERDNFHALFQQAMEGNLIFHDNHCVEANQSAVILFGKPVGSSLQYLSINDLICGDQWDEALYAKVRSAFTLCTARGYSHLQFSISTPIHDQVWIDASLTLIHYLKKPAIYMVCRDVSAQKQLEQELSNARQAAEAGNQAKSDFIARVSHEIRTPLNVIIGSTRLLKSHSDHPELVKDKAHSIQRAGERLMLQIEDVLNFSRLEADEIPLYEEPLNLAEVVSENTDFFCDMASKKYLELECYADPQLETLALMLDLSRLNQILTNLMTNAIKYTEKGKITLHASLAHLERPTNKADISIAVKDTGVGISPQDQQLIFNNFVRTSTSENQQQEGSGLGLTISKKLAELMGGTLDVVSTPGQGSTFTLRLRGVEVAAPNSPAAHRYHNNRRSSPLPEWPLHLPSLQQQQDSLPKWYRQLNASQTDHFSQWYKQQITPLLKSTHQNKGLSQLQILAQGLQGCANPDLAKMGDQMLDACKLCDIARIEAIHTQLTLIEKTLTEEE